MSFKRDIGPDITRIVAYFSVLGVHFFLNSGFYETPVMGRRMFVMVIMRTFFMICVPLFMILSGYLYSERKIAIQRASFKKHIQKLFRIICIYNLRVFHLYFQKVPPT